MRSFMIITCLTISSGATGQVSGLPDSLQTYLDTVLNLIERRSLYGKHADWPMIRDSANSIASNARNIQDLMPAIKYVFTTIGDHHGGLLYRGQKYGMEGKKIVVGDEFSAVWKIGAKIRTQILDSEYAYIFIPPIWALTETETTMYAQQIQDSICKLNRSNIRGWIVDLRANLGGNMYAMIGGLGCLIGDGVLGSFIDAKGHTTHFLLKMGDAFEGTKRWTNIQNKCMMTEHPKIAILLSQLTSSSGEIVAIAFKGRPMTKFIGENTAGYVTANDDPYFIDKDSMLLVAAATISDRNHKLYTDFVQPDLNMIGGDNFIDLKRDLKVKASLQWLKE